MTDDDAKRLRALAERARGNNIGAVSAMATLGGEYEAILALLDERDAAMALLQRRARALIAIESIARNSETAGVLPDIARIAADALLGDGGEG